MKPKKAEHKPQRELFRVELSLLVDSDHPLVKLGGRINWAAFEEHLAPTYHDKTGAPGIDTRLMVALHYLKYQHDLSDEAVVAGWVENPYWQHFSGRQYFEHELPIDPSSMTRWRKRLGEAGAEAMLKATIETGVAMGVIRANASMRRSAATRKKFTACTNPKWRASPKAKRDANMSLARRSV